MLNQKDTGSGYTDHLSYGTSFLDGSGCGTNNVYYEKATGCFHWQEGFQNWNPSSTPSSILNSIYYIVLGLDGLSSPLYHNLEEKSRGF